MSGGPRTHSRDIRSVPVVGMDGTGFESTDAPAKVVVFSLVIVAALAVFAFGLMFGYDKFLEAGHPRGTMPSPLSPERVVPPAPQLERLPWLDLPVMRAHETEVLNSTGKDSEGRSHIPIQKAIDLMATRMNAGQDAPTGLTTPGGQDRVFSHGLADMPPAYQQAPAIIQGEIRKDAK